MPFNITAIEEVLADIRRERLAQENRFGPQVHPWLPIGAEEEARATFGEELSDLRALNDSEAELGCGSWVAILLEEFVEATVETDPIKLEQELIQVAAVAAAAVQDLRNRRLNPGN